jgi:hypothetical protein
MDTETLNVMFSSVRDLPTVENDTSNLSCNSLNEREELENIKKME